MRTFQHESLKIYQIPLRKDNYTYLLTDDDSGETLVVDPAESPECLELLEALGRPLSMILNTHHHDDHVHGNKALKERYGCRIYGSAHDKERIPGLSDTLKGGDTVRFAGRTLKVFDTPGHTLGHISYFLPDANWLFCGDTLFALGCGRLFEGTPEMMWQSLRTLRDLPPESLVFCAHEYTLANARFALHIAPDFPGLKEHVLTLETRLKHEGATVPTRLEKEKAFNPFLLADHPYFKSQGDTPVEVFAAIRKAKDQF